MLYLLNWRLWAFLSLAGLLTLSHVTAYRSGASHVRAEWNLARNLATTEARKLEQARQLQVDAAAVAQAKRDAALRADASRAAAAVDGMRGAVESAQRASKESRDAAERIARVSTELLGQCSREYQSLAVEADRADSYARTLMQAWPK